MANSTRSWSSQQQAIFDRLQFPTPGTVENLVVEAFAGCGKTTTIIEAINRAPEARIGILTFAKRNQKDAAALITNPNAEAVTSHSLGFRAVKRYWEKIGIDKSGKRVANLVDQACGQSAPDAIKRLVGQLCTKVRELAPFATAASEAYEIAQRFDCVPDDEWSKDGFDLHYVCDKAVYATELAAASKPATGIDFADMLFLPLRNKWLRPIYDLIVIDEAQDMTLVQLLLAQGSCSGRIVVVGDPNQAIYGFRGADSNSMNRLREELKAATLGLTCTYRCGKAIVEAARRYVPTYEAAAGNPDGVINRTVRTNLIDRVAAGDFILSRTNAPLVGVALALLRQGRRAKIEGRDIGAGLKAIVTRLATGPAKSSMPKFLAKLATWRDREVERAVAAKQDRKAETIVDQHDTLLALTDGATGVPELFVRLDHLFDDNLADAPATIVCSSIHKAKGAEADRVFILEDTLNPPVACVGCRKRPNACKCDRYVADPQAAQEEQNAVYVAITRAKVELVWVTR